MSNTQVEEELLEHAEKLLDVFSVLPTNANKRRILQLFKTRESHKGTEDMRDAIASLEISQAMNGHPVHIDDVFTREEVNSYLDRVMGIIQPNESAHTQPRNQDGTYSYDGNWDRVCVCGHTLGEFHTAETPHACGNNGTGLVDCDCSRFRFSKSKTEEMRRKGTGEGETLDQQCGYLGCTNRVERIIAVPKQLCEEHLKGFEEWLNRQQTNKNRITNE
jgi:hypothetical protein